MTRPAAQIERALWLRARGHTASGVARELSIPRSTVREWLSGQVPESRKPGVDDCTTCGNAIHVFATLGPSYVYLLGLYLGDGCISAHRRDVYRLRIVLDAAYPGIIEEAASTMSSVRPESKVAKLLRPDHSVQVSSYSKSWPCLFPQHGRGKKHLRRIWLAEWQHDLVRAAPKPLLRGLIHSDGCRFMNTGRNWRHPRYSFVNLSPEIRKIFTDACELLELRWTSSGHTVYISRKDDVAKMDEFVGPKA